MFQFVRQRMMLVAGLVASLVIEVSPARAQSARTPTTPTIRDTLFEVRLSDGSQVFGRIEVNTADSIVLVTTSGIRMTIPRSKIAEQQVADGRSVDGEYWQPDANKTRLFFAPTARAIGAGKGYAGTFMVMLPFVGAGIGNHFSIAGGAPILFGQTKPIYVAPKITLVEKPNASAAIGTLAFLGIDDDAAVGVAYAMATAGDWERAVTIGIGFGYAGSDIAGNPAVMIGGESRVSRRLKLITENYLIAGETGMLLTGGARIVGDRLSADIGVMAGSNGKSIGCCLPIVNFSYALGK